MTVDPRWRSLLSLPVYSCAVVRWLLRYTAATNFFVSEAELASAELGGSNPGGHGSVQSGAGLHDGDDCSMM